VAGDERLSAVVAGHAYAPLQDTNDMKSIVAAEHLLPADGQSIENELVTGDQSLDVFAIGWLGSLHGNRPSLVIDHFQSLLDV